MRRGFVKSVGGGWQRYEPHRRRGYGFAGRTVVQANNSVPLKGFFLVHLAAAAGAEAAEHFGRRPQGWCDENYKSGCLVAGVQLGAAPEKSFSVMPKTF